MLDILKVNYKNNLPQFHLAIYTNHNSFSGLFQHQTVVLFEQVTVEVVILGELSKVRLVLQGT